MVIFNFTHLLTLSPAQMLSPHPTPARAPLHVLALPFQGSEVSSGQDSSLPINPARLREWAGYTAHEHRRRRDLRPTVERIIQSHGNGTSRGQDVCTHNYDYGTEGLEEATKFVNGW